MSGYEDKAFITQQQSFLTEQHRLLKPASVQLFAPGLLDAALLQQSAFLQQPATAQLLLDAELLPPTPSLSADQSAKAKRSRVVAETAEEVDEEKRRRNTAASARFRAKKKAKEEAVSTAAGIMAARVAVLNQRIAEQDTEIRWLRGLITQRDGQGALDRAYITSFKQ